MSSSRESNNNDSRYKLEKIFVSHVQMPEGYIIRPLEAGDYDKNYLGCISQLSDTVQNVSREAFENQVSFFNNSSDYFPVVVEHLNRIVGSGTLLVEKKIIRGCGLVGHMEDIVVDQSQRGKNLGKLIIEQLTLTGKKLGCYKVILNCSEKNKGFYEKCGYLQKEVEMACYF